MTGRIDVGQPLRAEQFLVGGRGYGKNAALAEARRRYYASIPIGKPRTFAPGIGEVAWACKKPTDTVCTPRQGGWWRERTSAYLRGEADMLDIITEAKNAAREGKWVI